MKKRHPDSRPLAGEEPPAHDSFPVSRSLAFLLPGELMLARCRAFREGDFAFIYDSYHPEANFLGHFPDREAYLHYAREVLALQFQFLAFRVLREEVGAEEARVLFYQKVQFNGDTGESIELARLLRTEEGWRYLGGEKVDRGVFSLPLEAIGWDEFARTGEKIFY